MIAESLLEALRALDAAFDPNELAYLALTSKVELPVRDRLAWQLHNRIAEHGFCVAREWRRSDLAILDHEGTPVAILEAKAFYGFDVARGMAATDRYTVAIARDLAKARRLGPDAQTFALALCTTPLAHIPPPLQQLAKYADYVNAAINEFGDPAVVRHKAQEHVTARLATLGPVEALNLGDGNAYDLRVSVDAWLVGPVTGASLVC